MDFSTRRNNADHVRLGELPPRAPGHVKRPMNAFMVWAKEQRKEFRKQNPNAHNAEVSKYLGTRWNELTAAEKQPFVDRAQALKEEHLAANPGYKYCPRRRIMRLCSPEGAFGSSPLGGPGPLPPGWPREHPQWDGGAGELPAFDDIDLTLLDDLVLHAGETAPMDAVGHHHAIPTVQLLPASAAAAAAAAGPYAHYPAASGAASGIEAQIVPQRMSLDPATGLPLPYPTSAAHHYPHHPHPYARPHAHPMVPQQMRRAPYPLTPQLASAHGLLPAQSHARPAAPPQPPASLAYQPHPAQLQHMQHMQQMQQAMASQPQPQPGETAHPRPHSAQPGAPALPLPRAGLAPQLASAHGYSLAMAHAAASAGIVIHPSPLALAQLKQQHQQQQQQARARPSSAPVAPTSVGAATAPPSSSTALPSASSTSTSMPSAAVLPFAPISASTPTSLPSFSIASSSPSVHPLATCVAPIPFAFPASPARPAALPPPPAVSLPSPGPALPLPRARNAHPPPPPVFLAPFADEPPSPLSSSSCSQESDFLSTSPGSSLH